MNTDQQRRAFTLVELLAVIVVLAILATVAIPRYIDYADRARRTAATTTLKSISRAMIQYNNLYGNSTTSVELTAATLRTIPALVEMLPAGTLGPSFPLGATNMSWVRDTSTRGEVNLYNPSGVLVSDTMPLATSLGWAPGGPTVLDWDSDDGVTLIRLSYVWE